MQVVRLDHVNDVTGKPEKMVARHEAILGLRSGERPGLGVDGLSTSYPNPASTTPPPLVVTYPINSSPFRR